MTDVEAAMALDRAEERWLADARERLHAAPPTPPGPSVTADTPERES